MALTPLLGSIRVTGRVEIAIPSTSLQERPLIKITHRTEITSMSQVRHSPFGKADCESEMQVVVV